MNRLLVVCCILILSSGVYAKGQAGDARIQATTYTDGVLFEVNAEDQGMQLVVSGPGKSVNSKRYSSADPVFLNTNGDGGEPMPDGLYKYEATVIPAITISREESANMRDRNLLIGKSDPKSSPVSGYFRIADGMVVDPMLVEYGRGQGKGENK